MIPDEVVEQLREVAKAFCHRWMVRSEYVHTNLQCLLVKLLGQEVLPLGIVK